MTESDIRGRFGELFGADCRVVARAPGRVNLIGEHTDYNDGFVLPVALSLHTRAAGRARDDAVVRIHSGAMGETRSWALGEWKAGEHPGWTAYFAGVIELLAKAARIERGCDLLVESTVPAGSGLSSSASIEIATASALMEMHSVEMGAIEMIDLCQRSDHEYMGVPCGILDQTASLLCGAGCALLLDCRSRETRQIPCILPDHEFIVADTGVRHAHAGGEYAVRREECERALAYLQKYYPEARALRDVSSEMLERHWAGMEERPAARARHVVSENRRTLAAAEALAAGDAMTFGELMNESHRSLRDDYETSCPELDRLVNLINEDSGSAGARMTGGGFGGCVAALVEKAARGRIEAMLAERYRTPTGEAPAVLVVEPGFGAGIEYRG